MAYRYSAIHNTILHDGNDTDDSVIEDGKVVRVPMMLMDSMQRAIAADSMQRAIASNSTTVDDGDRSRREAYDFAKAELGARYRGGLTEGDTFRLGNKMMVVTGRNPVNGKVQLSDASTSAQDAETARQDAYDLYDHDIQNSWMNSHDAKAGDDCTTAGREPGRWRERAKDGRLVCVFNDKSSKENEIAGPLSDAEMVQVKDRMYSDYDAELAQRWRR